MAIQHRKKREGLGKMRICSPPERRANTQALAGILGTYGILANRCLTLIPCNHRTTMCAVNFVVRHILPLFQYLFLAGLIGAIPVIIVTAIRTAESMFEEDHDGQTGRRS